MQNERKKKKEQREGGRRRRVENYKQEGNGGRDRKWLQSKIKTERRKKKGGT